MGKIIIGFLTFSIGLGIGIVIGNIVAIARYEKQKKLLEEYSIEVAAKNPLL
jgi:hypothetical protein